MWKTKISIFLSLLIRYKFWFTLLFFIVWILFLDNYNYFYKEKMKEKIEDLKSQKKYYSEKITKDSIRLFNLKTKNDVLEQFAREKYLMKKKNEDLFIIIEK